MGFPPYPVGGYTSNAVPAFPFASAKAISEIDLRAEMKQLLELRGHWVVLRRMDQRQKCFCWNEQGEGEKKLSDDNRKYDEPKTRCPSCDGEGWIYREELHLVRRRLVSPEIGLAAQENLTDVGLMNINYIVFYFQYYVNPTKKDIIYEIELDATRNPIRPFIYKERYNISVAEPFRDQLGRIEYYRVACQMEAT